MSAMATFDCRSKTSILELRQSLSALWSGESVDVRELPQGFVSVQLSYFVGRREEAAQLKRVVVYLLTASTDRILHYFRDRDAFIEVSDPDYVQTLMPDDLLSPDFQPGMYNGIQYRYVIKSGNAGAQIPSGARQSVRIYLPIGGLVAAGFDPSGVYLLTITHSGRGVFSTRTWKRVARDTALAYPEAGVGIGIGPIDGRAIPVTEMDFNVGRMRVVSPDGRIILECESSGIAVTVA